MDSEEEYLSKQLKSRTYRELQQTAKSMGLPSNFKKIYLIEAILAKKFKSEEDVENIIQRVFRERMQLSQVKKYKHLKALAQVPAERISEARYSSSYSPPITVTPKRLSNSLTQNSTVSTELLCKESLNPKRNLLHKLHPKQHNSSTAINAVNSSDRVLRSYSLKTEKPNYALINNNVLELKTQCADTETNYKIISHRASKCYVSQIQLSEHSRSITKRHNNVIATSGEHILERKPAKRQRKISGIYPLQPKETLPFLQRNLNKIKTVPLRQIDGSTINAFVQKCNVFARDVNMQDVFNMDVNVAEDLTITNDSNNSLKIQYPNTGINAINFSNTSVTNTQITINDNCKENNPTLDMQITGCERRVTEHQWAYQSTWDAECQQLPKINDVFTSLTDMRRKELSQPLYVHVGTEAEIGINPITGNMWPKDLPQPLYVQAGIEAKSGINPITDDNMCPKDLSQPLYVQVDTHTESVQNNPIYVYRSDPDKVLEPMYNIRTDTPQQKQAKIAATECVFAVKTIPTATVYSTPPSPANHSLYVYSPDNDPFPDIDMRLRDFLQLQPMRGDCDRFLDPNSSSSLDTTETTASIPEMVEDALEIISQDGDYMEHMGMSARIQCVFCCWAGPKIILEGHMRKEHSDSIHKLYRSDWNMTFTLESLVRRRAWLNRVVEHDTMLYMLSVRYEHPGCFMAALSSLSTGPEPDDKICSITLYNKITGVPFSWTGQTLALPPNDDDVICFKIDLRDLDLLPNSADLKLLNREPQEVTDSPENLIVGYPTLNDIHIIVFVRILN